MTDQELKDLVAGLAIQSAEVKMMFKEQNDEYDKRFTHLNANLDGISKTQGEITQDYFFNILKDNKRIANLTFDGIERNSYKYIRNDMKGEYDIVLFNGDSVMVVEIKNKIREKDIQDLKNKQIKNLISLCSSTIISPFFCNTKKPSSFAF
nr:hypothetical protein [Sulfurimonas sp.]